MKRRFVRAVAPGVALVAGLGGALAASATGGAPSVVVRKTVLVTMNPDGSATSKRVYTQLTATGNGAVTVTDPVDGAPLRNLDGFAAPPVSNGHATYALNVNGRADRRTVQDFTGSLPISISVATTLDGAPIAPGAVVDKSGLLKVTYTVKNVSAVTQTLQVPDGHGGTVAKQENIPVPLVGTMATTLPSSFAAVDAPGAAIGADGHGGSLVNYTLLMFEPLGSSTATLSYSAQLTHGSLPSVEFQFLPVAPAANPTTKSAQDQYQGGQDQGQQLTTGATTIDANLLKLQNGAGQLLAGLQKLAAGAGQLSDGLNGQAAPGATKIASGLDQAKSGGQQLADGLSLLAGGMGVVHDTGTGLAATAAAELATAGSDLANACAAAHATCNATDVKVVAQWAANQIVPLIGNAPAGCDPTGALQCAVNALSAGANKLLAGLGLLDAGAHTLADGLGTAGNGASQIAAGLGLAVPGGSQIHAGAGLLSKLGTKKLIAAGLSTVSAYGEKFAIMQALNARIAAGDGIPNGPATGATTTGAYDFRLAAASDAGTTNLIRLVLALVLFGLAIAVPRLRGRLNRIS